MKNKLKTANSIVGDDKISSPYWKRRPSEIRGYQRALYYNMPDGSYLRIDYNIKDKKVRIYLEDEEEGGIQYYSVITDGKVTAERNVTNGRSISLHSKFTPIADVIATIPNKQVVDIIGSNYGVSNAKNKIKESQRKKKIEKTRQRYFRDNKNEGESVVGEFHPSKKIRFVDLLDVVITVVISYLIYYRTLNIHLTGAIVAISGVIYGIIDMFIRNREPIFTKIIVAITIGMSLYVYGYYFI